MKCSDIIPDTKIPPCEIYVPNVVMEMKMRKTIDIDGEYYECMVNNDGFWRPCVYDKENKTVSFS